MTQPQEGPSVGPRSVEELLREIEDGAHVGKAIAARRTPLSSLASRLGPWTDMLEASIALAIAKQGQEDMASQLDELHRGASTTFAAPSPHDWRCAADSIAGMDLAVWAADGWPSTTLQPPHESDQGPVLRFVRRIVDATIDNLRGIEVLLATSRSTRAPIALARIVLDGTAHGSYVIDLDATAEERLVRALNEMLSRLGEDYNAAGRSGDPQAQGRAETAIRGVIDAAGTRRKANWNPQRGSTPFLGDSPVPTARMARKLLEGAAIWNELSGVVHNKEDEGWRMMLGLFPGMENPHRDSYVALYTFAAMLGTVRLVELLEAYTGWDLSLTREASQSLCIAWADASGQYDDLHRAIVVAVTDVPQPKQARSPKSKKKSANRNQRRR